MAYTNKEAWIGGLRGVPLSRITAWLYRVENALRNALSETDTPTLPDDWLSSREAGDDDLPWPAERLRFHWSLPRVGEDQWSRETMPDNIARPLAERFLRLRERDSKD